MNKFKIVALLVACILIFSGCSLVRIDEDKVADQVVANVNGTEIYRAQVDEQVNYNVPMQLSYYGMEESDLEKDELAQMYEEQMDVVLEQLVLNELMLQKAEELDIVLTDEEKDEKRTQADEALVSIKESIRAEVEGENGIGDSVDVETDAENTAGDSVDANVSEEETTTTDPVDIEAEVEVRYNEYLATSDFTADSYYEELCEQSLISKVREYIYGFAEVTEEEAQEWYDQTLTLQQEETAEDPEAFESYVHNKNIYTCVPENTVAVKQVFLAFVDEELTTQAQTLYDEGKADEAMALLQDEIAALMPTALEVEQRLEDGENIDDLIAELGEDANMTAEPYATYGYLIESRTVEHGDEFRDAALGLAKVGDVSKPFATYTGIHVLQSIAEYTQGTVPYEDLMVQIEEALLPSQQTAKYEEMKQQWLDEADITYYSGKLTYMK